MMYVLVLLLVCGGVVLTFKRRRREKNQPAIVPHDAYPEEPVLPAETKPIVVPFRAELPPSAADGEYAVLVADDQPLIRLLLKELFQQDGITVYEAENGHAAIETVRRHRVDFVLLDLNMPGMNGLEALKAIKQLNDRVEAAFVTGYGDPDLLEEAKRIGVFACFTKPFDIDVVRKHVLNSRKSANYGDGEVS